MKKPTDQAAADKLLKADQKRRKSRSQKGEADRHVYDLKPKVRLQMQPAFLHTFLIHAHARTYTPITAAVTVAVDECCGVAGRLQHLNSGKTGLGTRDWR